MVITIFSATSLHNTRMDPEGGGGGGGDILTCNDNSLAPSFAGKDYGRV